MELDLDQRMGQIASDLQTRERRSNSPARAEEGYNILQRLGAAGALPSDIAKILGVSGVTVGRWRRGDAPAEEFLTPLRNLDARVADATQAGRLPLDPRGSNRDRLSRFLEAVRTAPG